MEPMELMLSPNTRRRMRGGRGTVVLGTITTATTMTNATVITPEILNAMPMLSRFHVGPSPDEMVIQARGRRQLPITFSPDVHLQGHSYGHHLTPTRQKQLMSRQQHSLSQRASTGSSGISRLLLPTRSSPRKRLTLTDSPPDSSQGETLDSPVSKCQSTSLLAEALLATPSPDKVRKSPVAKKCRLEAVRSAPAETVTLLKGLSHAQLTQLFAQVLAKHPELEKEVVETLPQPDLGPMEERLLELKRNIFKSLPATRLESRTDSMAYTRAATHLLAFKKAITDQSKQLIDSCHWASAVDHTILAWSYVKATPVWDNHPHNNMRKQCFKLLAANCMQALKKGNWSLDLAVDIKNKLADMEKDSDDIIPCQKQLEMLINNGNVTGQLINA